MTSIHFIINPISGNGNHGISASLIREYFPHQQFQVTLEFTKYKSHAIPLTEAAMLQKPDCIVACGGDGTISEVASRLVNSEIKLGIVPLGSGNGLASNLNIPKNIGKALEIIRNGQVSFIDAGKVNGHYFFSNMGIGIDAMIVRKYEESKGRKLWAYVKAGFSSAFRFQPQWTILAGNSQIINLRPLLLFVSNSNEMGYGMSLTPKASLSDGLLDVFVVPELTFSEKLSLAYNVIGNRIDRFDKGSHMLASYLKIEQPEKIFIDIQIDGEFHNAKTNVLEIRVLPKALKVIC